MNFGEHVVAEAIIAQPNRNTSAEQFFHLGYPNSIVHITARLVADFGLCGSEGVHLISVNVNSVRGQGFGAQNSFFFQALGDKQAIFFEAVSFISLIYGHMDMKASIQVCSSINTGSQGVIGQGKGCVETKRCALLGVGPDL
jgi:hypothetical protein